MSLSAAQTPTPIAWGAVWMLAMVELRRHWRSLLALGMLAGLSGAAVLGALAAGRRTATAYDRLKAAGHIDDARVLYLGSPAPAVASLPGVRASRTAVFGVGKLAGPGVTYWGVQSLAPQPDDLATPVIVEGRMFAEESHDEAVMVEAAAARFGVRLGDVLRLHMLTLEEVMQFATGFGEPDGPVVEVRISGFARTPGPMPDPSPLLVSPAFLARHPDALVVGSVTYLRLVDGNRSLAQLREGLQGLRGPVSASDLTLALPQLLSPTESEPTVRTTTRVLSGGLLVFAILVGVVGMVVVALAFVRHQSRGAADQRVEAALGLTAGEQAGARTVAGLVAATVAAASAAGGALSVAGIAPLGGLGNFEPNPGWSPNLAVIVPGALLTGLVTLATVALTARGARRVTSDRVASAHRLLIHGPPWLATGVRFALDGRAGRRRVPVRSSLAGVVLGVLGVVATSTFVTSRDRLVSTPSRWGSFQDFTVVDVTPPVVTRLVSDERVDSLSVIRAGVVRAQGAETSGYALLPSKGRLGWTVLEGGMPANPDEVMLGSRLARRLGLQVGDALMVEDTAGRQLRFVVVGTGLGPSIHRERLGDNLLFSGAGLERVQRAQPDHEALVRVRSGVDVDRFREELGRELEIDDRQQPAEVRNLVELGRLPLALGASLGLIAAVALGHALVVTAHRRAWDLAVLRVLGLTPKEAGGALLAMAFTTAVLGTVGGMVLGVAAGRLAWTTLVEALGLSAALTVPASGLIGIALAIVVGSMVIAVVPAWRAGHMKPAPVLRQE